MTSPESISVVITTFNRSDALLTVLAGLVLQTDRNFEVVVADDGSREEHRRAILTSAAARELRVVHVWHPDVGFTASQMRNLGVAAAKGHYIIFLDGDCVPELDLIAQHKALAQSGCFVNGSRVLLSTELTQRVLAGSEPICGRSSFYWIKKRLLGQASKLSHLLRLSDGAWRLERKFSWKGIRSCNMGLWRTDFERVDGFDESFVGWGHEDADLVLRLHHCGVVRKNGFCATEVFHLWHREANRNNASQNAQLVRDRVQNGQLRSTLGYSQVRATNHAVVTRL